jgi:hypothetical protein
MSGDTQMVSRRGWSGIPKRMMAYPAAVFGASRGWLTSFRRIVTSYIDGCTTVSEDGTEPLKDCTGLSEDCRRQYRERFLGTSGVGRTCH